MSQRLAVEFQSRGLAPFTFRLEYAEQHPTPLLYEATPHHVHEECELYLCLEGDVSFMVEDQVYPMTRGSVILAHPYEYHHCIYHSNVPNTYYWILFTADGNEKLLNLFFDREKGTHNLIRLSDEGTLAMIRVFERLRQPDSTEQEKLLCFLQMLDVLRHGTVGKGAHSEERSLPNDVALAIDYINAHLTDPIRIRSLATLCHVSLNTLERHFLQELNTTPSEFLRIKRLVLAADLLRAGKTVTEAYVACGFSDYSHFISNFGEHFGMTPLQYKKKYHESKKAERR